MTKINLQNLKLFANNNIADIGKFLIRLINFIFYTIQELITNNLNINDIDFFTKNKNLVLSNIDPKENKYEGNSDDLKKIGELDVENNNLRNQILDLRNQILDLNNKLSSYKNKISEISVDKNKEIEILTSKIGIQDKQINEFKKILQAMQQKSNEKNKDIKVI